MTVNRCKSQKHRKRVMRVTKGGRPVDEFESIRQMSRVLGYDRRAIIRVLQKQPGYKTIDGYRIKYCFIQPQ